MRSLCQTITITRIGDGPWQAFAWKVFGLEYDTGTGATATEALESLSRGRTEHQPVVPTMPTMPAMSLRQVVDLACQYVGLDYAEMVGPSRYSALVASRRMVWYLVYKRGTGVSQAYSWPEIAAACGKQSHSTLLSSFVKVKPYVGSPDLNETEQEWAQVRATQRVKACGAGCQRMLALWAKTAHQGRQPPTRTSFSATVV